MTDIFLVTLFLVWVVIAVLAGDPRAEYLKRMRQRGASQADIEAAAWSMDV